MCANASSEEEERLGSPAALGRWLGIFIFSFNKDNSNKKKKVPPTSSEGCKHSPAISLEVFSSAVRL